MARNGKPLKQLICGSMGSSNTPFYNLKTLKLMPQFIILKKEDRLKLFDTVKKKTKLSFNKLPFFLNTSRTSFFNYYSRGRPIPIEIFRKLKKTSRLKILDYKLLEKERFLRNKIKIPELNESLAEIIGALNGDGHISKYKYEVNIVSHSDEKSYQEHLKNLFVKTFGITLSNYLQDNTIKIRIYSIDLHRLLTEEYGLPIGKKKGKLKIPKQVFSSRRLLISYIRGLFDTDGSFYIRRKKDPVLEISSADSRFLKEVKNALVSLNFNVVKGINKLVIYKKDDIMNFYKVIKPANSKHLKKFKIYSNL